MRRPAVCGKLGFPATSRTVKTLKLVSPWQQDCLPVLLLRELLRFEPSANRIFTDFSKITEERLATVTLGHPASLRLAFPEERHIGHVRWFFQLPAAVRAHIGGLYEVVRSSRDDMRAFLEPLRPLAAFRNEDKAIAHLRGYVQRRMIVQRACRTIFQNDDPEAWPPPPLTGTSRICPITSFQEIVDEGNLMAHCAISLTPKIMRGEYYLYRVLASQRGTLALRFHRDEWRLDQFLGPRNETICDPSVWQEIENWPWNAPTRERRTSYQSNIFKLVAKATGMAIRANHT